jgi:hypothetical protein
MQCIGDGPRILLSKRKPLWCVQSAHLPLDFTAFTEELQHLLGHRTLVIRVLLEELAPCM